MSEQVRSSTKLWSQEVAEARALDADQALPGQAGIAALEPPIVKYEFSNGRRFFEPRDPYA